MERLTNEQLWEVCNKYHWFTGGTNEQYEKLFNMNEAGDTIEVIALAIWLCTDKARLEDITAKLEDEGFTEGREKRKIDCKDMFHRMMEAFERTEEYFRKVDLARNITNETLFCEYIREIRDMGNSAVCRTYGYGEYRRIGYAEINGKAFVNSGKIDYEVLNRELKWVYMVRSSVDRRLLNANDND